jgi:hypothetical protein
MDSHQFLRRALLLLLAAPLANAAPDLSGIWMLSSMAKEGELRMTERAREIQANYDLLVDDPSLYCEPASTSRVWANPNVRIAFEQADDHVLISYEFYDLRRMIPLGDEDAMPDMPSTRNVAGTYFRKMGSSFGRYENDRLIIETRAHEPGYVRTSRGVPQSENTVTTEELWVDAGTLRLRQTYVDDTLYEIPFVIDYAFQRTGENEMPLYECTDASYDWFEKLNAPSEDEQE